MNNASQTPQQRRDNQTPQQRRDNQTPQQRRDNQTSQQRRDSQTLQQKKRRKKKQTTVEKVREQLETEMLEDFQDDFVPPLPPPLYILSNSETSDSSVSEAARNLISTSAVGSRYTANPTSSISGSRHTANPISSTSGSGHTANPTSSTSGSRHTANPISSTSGSGHTATPISSTSAVGSRHTGNPISSTSRYTANPTSRQTANPISSTSTIVTQTTGSITSAGTFNGTAGPHYSGGAWNYLTQYPPYSPAYAAYPPQSNSMWSYSSTVSQPTVSQSANHQVTDFYEQVQQLDGRVKIIEDKLAELGPVLQDGHDNDDDLGLGLSREQNITIKMICNSMSTQWKPALRKILAIVYGHQVLAVSCAVGRTNANSTPALDGRKLDIIKSTYVHVHMRNCINVYIIGLMYEHFTRRHPNEITNESINIVVNSACALSKRKLKQKE